MLWCKVRYPQTAIVNATFCAYVAFAPERTAEFAEVACFQGFWRKKESQAAINRTQGFFFWLFFAESKSR